ncbi:thiamine phosphate synthase [Corynebacterium pygosceleis]|uniref:thiamine phosphate synthase n=1 Tax=Corynebacterium pygosceleis TaxID=2800406 RepID=UPI002003D040|nr:thiamine phosphate synthase [Corynebacterium pygosceleis]MCK7674572.1 thiamine phosphate synthase [Corynebacterium pygosceleis]
MDDRFRVALRHGFHLHIEHGDIDHAEARRRVPDVAGIGPVWSKGVSLRRVSPIGPGGVDAIARLTLAAGVPGVARGGITVDNVDRLGDTAVEGIRVSSAPVTSPDPYRTVRSPLTRFRRADAPAP